MAFPDPWDDFDTLKNPMRWVRKVVFEVWIRSRSRPNMFVHWRNVKIFSILPFSRGQLYAEVPSWWGEFEPSSALAVLTPPISAYDSSRLLVPAHLDSDVWIFASCAMCAHVLKAF